MGLPIGTKINGALYQFSSVEAKVQGLIHTNVSEINYSDGLEPGEFRGTSPVITGRTTGIYSTDGSLTMYKSDCQKFIAGLATTGAALQQGFMQVAFEVTVSYREGILDAMITDTLVGCRIKHMENGHSAGNDALVVKLDLSIFRIKYNGLDAVGGGGAGAVLGAVGGLIGSIGG